MKLIKLIKDLIKDKKNPRTLERIFVFLYLSSFVFLGCAIVGATLGKYLVINEGWGMITSMLIISFLIEFIIIKNINAIKVIIAIIVIGVVGLGLIVGIQTSLNLILYLIVADVIITLIAELICWIVD
jgi:hypothetical protein